MAKHSCVRRSDGWELACRDVLCTEVLRPVSPGDDIETFLGDADNQGWDPAGFCPEHCGSAETEDLFEIPETVGG